MKSRVIRGIWTITICWNFDRDLRGKKKTLQRFDLCSASYEQYVVRAKASLARVGSWRTDARTFVKANPALGRSLRDVVEERFVLGRILQLVVDRREFDHASLRLVSGGVHNSSKGWRCPAGASD